MKLASNLMVCLFAAVVQAQLPPDVKTDRGADVPQFKVRPGYRVTRALPEKAKPIQNIRFIQFSEDGKVLFIANREQGEIYALRDPDENGVYKTVTVFLKN